MRALREKADAIIGTDAAVSAAVGPMVCLVADVGYSAAKKFGRRVVVPFDPFGVQVSLISRRILTGLFDWI